MFKGLLRVSVCAVALLGADEAKAQWAVECVNCTTELTEVLREAARIQNVLQQIQYAESQLQQLQNVYSSIAHLPDSVVSQLGQSFNVAQLRNALPTTPGSIGSLMNGTNMGSLSALGQQYLGQNRIYAPQGSDYNTASITNNASSIASVQSMADQLYQSAAAHTTALQNLEGQLAGAPDEKAVADISARVQMEQTYIASQQVQAQAIGTWQQAQVRNYEQQKRENRRCLIDATLARINNGDGDSWSAESCATPGANSAISGATPASFDAGSGGGGAGSVAGNPSKYLGQSVGSGQCVALVQAADPSVGLTRTWTQGAQVMGNTNLQPGTAIATFDGSGHYANATDGSSHAAIYLGQNAQGMQVEDQWSNHATSIRTIPWNNTSGAANTGSAFYVISH